MNKPRICGECERFFNNEYGTFCMPIKQKHGVTPVVYNQAPMDNCPYDYSHCVCGAPLVDGNCSEGCDNKTNKG